MYNVPTQSEPAHQQMLKLYQRMMQWTAHSKKALDQGNLDEHHQLLERMTDLQQRIVGLFEPPPHATAPQKQACNTMQAAARQTLIVLLDYVSNPQQNYNKLCQTLMKVYAGWQHLGRGN